MDSCLIWHIHIHKLGIHTRKLLSCFHFFIFLIFFFKFFFQRNKNFKVLNLPEFAIKIRTIIHENTLVIPNFFFIRQYFNLNCFFFFIYWINQFLQIYYLLHWAWKSTILFDARVNVDWVTENFKYEKMLHTLTARGDFYAAMLLFFPMFCWLFNVSTGKTLNIYVYCPVRNFNVFSGEKSFSKRFSVLISSFFVGFM